MMLGLQADVPNGCLQVNPTLPDWMPSLELAGLKVGRTELDLRFWREGDATRFEVASQRGDHLDVLLRPGPGERGGSATAKPTRGTTRMLQERKPAS